VKKMLLLLAAGLFAVMLAVTTATGSPKEITAFCGSAGKPALEAAAAAFQAKTGTRVYLNFGGSGTMLSQMELSRSGDLYLPGSPDYMLRAARTGVVDPETVRRVAYLVPAILVPRGNPAGIRKLSDLARPGVRVGLSNPKVVSVGWYAVEILEYNHLYDDVSRNVVTYAESYAKATSLLALEAVDAIIGWRIFAEWKTGDFEAVYLEPEQIPRIAYISGAVSTFSEDAQSSREFLEFLVSPEGQEIFRKRGYITTEKEAREYAPNAQIGGEN